MSWPLASANVIVEPVMNSLSERNPVAKSVVRDWTKIPSTIASWWEANEIGGTGIKYDEGSVYGSLTKTVCKSLIISAYSAFHTKSDSGHLEGVSRTSNYVCEPVTRVFGLTSRERQKQNATDTDYMEFAANNINAELLIQAAVEGIMKIAAADQAGQFLSKFGIFSFLKSSYIAIENKYIDFAIGTSGSYALLTERLHALYNAKIGLQKKVLVMPSLIILDFGLKITLEMITTCLLTPTSRITQDIAGNAINLAYDWYVDIFCHKDHDNILCAKKITTSEHYDDNIADGVCTGDGMKEAQDIVNLEL
ncbi:hypothetical protein Bandiella_00730 [Candidatus Bandiella woodruffii]|uniref:Uncharacterized protein n=2 Tax=Candidatus Bandiella euplotis TaxID=1664265 RepID=A0ABZ0UPI2_9RICK|nr:hypothetical protein Bandiella_00730 [Candidatus Bandiella woodruffii]